VITALVVLAFVFAAIPCALYFRNSKVFFRLGSATVAERRAISVLIPARNEERGIEACIRALIASEQVELEVIVHRNYRESTCNGRHPREVGNCAGVTNWLER
jgi:cellulose synthase/poly-beta-1,6-N-acetylglucosamine synthase-like glycosyltransferase